jgi:ascorbate-specific PTS system EIIC-type component UlaA
MKKKYLKTLLLILVGIGIISFLTASSFAPFASQGLHSTAAQILTPTPTPSTGTDSQTGSTDWITLMGVVIVLIVVLPVLFRRSTWTK